MKIVWASSKELCSILQMKETDFSAIMNEVDNSLFRKFYKKRKVGVTDYYSGNVVEAVKYYKIIKDKI